MRKTTAGRRSFLRKTARFGGAVAGASLVWGAPVWMRQRPGGDGSALAGGGPFDSLATAPRARFWTVNGDNQKPSNRVVPEIECRRAMGSCPKASRF